MDVLTRRQLIQYSAILSGALAGPSFVPPTTHRRQVLSLSGQSVKQEAGSQIASTPIDSSVFAGIFSTEVMRRVFSDQNRLQKYLDVEAALARVQGRLGIIPREAADEIQRHASANQSPSFPAISNC
jgi:hypothetical protein